MKKLLSLALALIMVLTLSVAVAAEEHTDMETVTISVTYNATNEDTTSPAEEFAFTIANTSVTEAASGVTKENMPTPTVGSVIYAAGEAGNAGTMTKNVTIDLPDNYTSVGIYTYTITPTSGTTAGVNYWASPIKLVVTVIQDANNRLRVAAVHTENGYNGTAEDGTKSDDISYTYSAGSLAVKKLVTGNLGDRDKEFNVTVTFTAPADKEVKSVISYTDGTAQTIATSAWKEKDGSKQAEITIALKHNETVTFTNIPYDVTYTVTEADYTSEGYDEEDIVYSDDANKKIDSATDTVTITNNKGTTVDTGVVLDSLPYILLIAVALVGVVAFTAKKRTTDR